MKTFYRRAMQWLYLGCIVLSGLGMVAITLIIPAGVFMRYVMHDPLQWPEPASVIMMVFFSFIGGAAVYRANQQIAVEALMKAVGPRSRTATGLLYAVLAGSIWWRNQSLCCENDSGKGAVRGTRWIGGRRLSRPALLARSIWAARAETEGASKTARAGSSTPKHSRTRETSWVASRECPPSTKKSSPAPTHSAWSSWAKIPTRSSSTGVRGAM